MDLPLLSDEAMEQVAGAVAAGGMSGVADLGAGELKRTRPDLDYARILLAGHSHGGDISMLCAREHPAMVQSVISLDNRRVAFPGTKRPRISSIRSSDRPADDGVIPPLEEQAKLGMKVIKLRETIHNDMWDGGSEERKAEITHYINGFLGEEQ